MTTETLKIRRASERGHADHGWLDTYHTFSFAGYRDPAWMHFGPLRVLNQDRVVQGAGFPTHGHADMEIVSYVLDGTLAHRDSMGNGSEMRHGDVQLMSAGTGVTHSEFNAGDDALHFLQMWVIPTERGTEPRYAQKHFDAPERAGRLRLVVSPDGAEGSLVIGADARMYTGTFAAGESEDFTLGEGRSAWLHVARGTVRAGDVELGPGDGAAVAPGATLAIEGVDAAELVLWDVRA